MNNRSTISRRSLVGGSAAALTVAGLVAAGSRGFSKESTPTPGTPGATPSASPSATMTIEVHTVDIAFEPKELTIPANTDVTVKIVNDGALQHDFAIDELDIVSDLLSSGDSTTVTINAAPGTYEYYCTVTGHREAGMVGTLTVE